MLNFRTLNWRNNNKLNQKIIDLERKEAVHYLAGHKIRAWIYRMLIKWYENV